jgi:lipopolysaccharide transport system permease protein
MLPNPASARVKIGPTQGWHGLNIGELYAYRDLIGFFIWRDIKVRYRQTVLGALWVLLKPLMTMILMTVVFGKLAGMPSDGISYPVFCFAGLVLWGFFTQAVTNASASLLNDAQLVEKVYFPRLAIPIAAATAGVLDFWISFGLLLAIMVPFGYYPTLRIFLCLPLLFCTLLVAIGIGAGFAALSVRFRDFSHLMSFLVQLWLFATPVIYPISLLPKRWQLLAAVNPLVGLVESFRWSLFGGYNDPWLCLSISVLSAATLVPAGLYLFRRLERTFADVI